MAANVACWRSDPLSRLRTPRRYWEDVSIAISRHVTRGPSLPTVDLESSAGADLRHAYQRYVPRAADAAGIRPWEPWRTVPIRRALRRERLEGRPFDDPGRAMLLTLGFRALGGVSPYLGLWLGVLACVPVLLWTSWELAEVLGLVATGLFLAPYAALRPPRHHAAWSGVWEGFGDFDRTKGHAWFDPEARKALTREGLRFRKGTGVDFETPRSESIFRRLVLSDIQDDPAWYAAILARRVFATVTQQKLWPYGPRDGVSFAPLGHPAEGATDVYYRMTTTADFVGLGGARSEVRIGLLGAPTLLLVVAWAGCRLGDPGAADRLGTCVAALLCVAGAALVLPVLITTASGPETQAFAVVYLLGFGFAVDELARLGFEPTAREHGSADPASAPVGAVVASPRGRR